MTPESSGTSSTTPTHSVLRSWHHSVVFHLATVGPSSAYTTSQLTCSRPGGHIDYSRHVPIPTAIPRNVPRSCTLRFQCGTYDWDAGIGGFHRLPVLSCRRRSDISKMGIDRSHLFFRNRSHHSNSRAKLCYNRGWSIYWGDWRRHLGNGCPIVYIRDLPACMAWIILGSGGNQHRHRSNCIVLDHLWNKVHLYNKCRTSIPAKG